MSDWVTVAKEAELAPGKWRKVDADGAQIVVFNLGVPGNLPKVVRGETVGTTVRES